MLRILLTIAALLLSTGASLASPQHPTSAQRKDIHRYNYAYLRCREYAPTGSTVPEAENQTSKKACDLRDRLSKKFERQGFCFYKYVSIGRPNKTTGECEALPGS
jgi:hypothetical protein